MEEELELTMQGLEDCFNRAIEENWSFVGIKIQMQGFKKPEIIINQVENFKTKLDYYKKAYNDNLTLKTFSGIKIIGFTYADDFEDIQIDLLGMED